MELVYVLIYALVWLLAINLWTILHFGEDKRAAIAGRQRVPESTLLTFAAIGGTPGAYFARARFRHKTRKQPFSFRLHLIATVQAGLAIGTAAATLPAA